MNFTEEQKKVITTRGGNLLVSASAGSGKTTVMIERILSLLLDDGVSLENMVICTFTRAAAADMREKLQTVLMEKANENNEIAQRQLALLPTAEISTLHSWCQRLIKMYFYAIGADPAFELLDENEALSLKNEAVGEAIAGVMGNPSEDFSLLYEIMESRRSDAPLRKLITKIYEFSRAQENPDEFLSVRAFEGAMHPRKCKTAIEEELKLINERYLVRARELLEETSRAGFTRNEVPLTNFCEFLEGNVNAGSSTPTGRIPPDMEELNEKFKKLKADYANATKGFDEFDFLPDPKINLNLVKVLVDLTKSMAKKYEEKKKKKAKLDYSDLEHLAKKLLQSDTMEEISQKYKYLFVDEYQDINPLQESMIALLKDVTVFAVGDVKQSIYAFRMCEPGIFLKKYNGYRHYGFKKPISLNENFRSTNEVLAFANEVFDELMTQKFGQIDYKNKARLIPGLNQSGGKVKLKAIVLNNAPVVVDGIYSVTRDTQVKRTAVDVETDVIVNDIISKLSGSIIVNGVPRPVRFSDFAVLFSARDGRVKALYEKLHNLGIPVSVTDKSTYESVYEVNILIEFLKYLTDFTNDISLVALLLSPLINMDEDELATVRKFDRKEKSFYALCQKYAKEKEDGIARKLNGFFALSNEYLTYSYTHTVGEILGKLVASQNWFIHLFSLADGSTKVDALESFLGEVNTASWGKSLDECVRYLTESECQYNRTAEANAVKLMTIHASKGLEFPFVFLMNTSRQFRNRELSDKVILDSQLGLCMRHHDEESRTVSPSKLTFVAGIKKKRALNEERMRLLYVALTRAKNELFVYASTNSKDKLFEGQTPKMFEEGRSFYDWLKPFYLSHGYELVNGDDVELIGSIDGVTSKKNASETVDFTDAKKYLDYVYPYQSAPVKSSVTAVMKEETEGDVPVYLAGEDDDRAAKRGSAYHKAMELIDFDADFEGEWERIKDKFASDLVEKDEIATAHKIVGQFVKGKQYYREQQFIYKREDGMLIQGVIDLLVIDNGKATVVDYKTSKMQTIRSGAYDTQLSLYMKASQEILGLTPEKAMIYSFKVNDFVEVKIT